MGPVIHRPAAAGKPAIVTADCSFTMKVRGFTKADLAPILAIQAACAQAARWVEADYLHLADDPGGLILVAELETPTLPEVLGFAALHRVMDVAELMNMAVDPEHQRQGIGRALLKTAWQRLLEAGARQAFLEVRPSNKAALQFYYPLGFRLHSVRKGYYGDPPEDAFVLGLELLPAAAMK
jgi:ribosomal-protein-alanine N-acetyltransferase